MEQRAPWSGALRGATRRSATLRALQASRLAPPEVGACSGWRLLGRGYVACAAAAEARDDSLLTSFCVIGYTVKTLLFQCDTVMLK